ncbi:hypothetical protein P9Y62_04135 [Bacillus thuringiensis]|uniref:Uncharacterized protein n=1 Tax=Bacillus thuringiensis HD-771 TaxID=1218175 RepID=A0A9W3P0E5_BACTU|nr:hypothetical protein [Bacillus thuringiensis]AFQ19015.1 hypothetical protein BTG_28090 [Bacillus thuringiensis HD-771]MDY8164265.1 hypothetical protein [Bacillus thuringiensis]MEB4891968.1 hypothetical protein [Bacillus thuringiensis]MEC2474239.1 hypothetical protein [Bacillus thuringiensis]MEC2560514.1 hypothetical protein [Bacillus thuringiensis]
MIVVACGGMIGEAFDVLCKACTEMRKQIEEFNELINASYISEEEAEYKERIHFYNLPVKVMKSQVVDRKPKHIRARTVC